MVGGTVQGDPQKVVEGAASLAEATDKDISFLGNPKYTSQLETTKAGAILATPDTKADGKNLVVLKNPPYGWARVLEVLQKERVFHPRGIHPTAIVSQSAQIGKNVAIGAYTVIEEYAVIGDNTIFYPHCYVGPHTRVGSNCLFYPRVTLRENITVGNRCIFHPGVVAGCDGFGFTLHQGRHYKIPQVGSLIIGDDVEVQANSTIDRGAAGFTRIGNGTKIDNLVQVAHNVETGENCLLVALTGIAGSTKLGHYVTLAAQTGIAGHLHLGDRSVVAAKSGVSHDIKPGEVVFGIPAQPIKDQMKTIAASRRLPELIDEFKKIKKKLGL